MVENIERIGRFTSSEIYKLMVTGKGPHGFGDKALTYIREKRIERRLGRSIDTEVYSRDMAWGTLLEEYVFDLLDDFGYELTSKDTDVHPEIPHWSGSKDLIHPLVKIGDIKCYQPKNFSILTDCILSRDTEYFKKNAPKEYWQLVSNAIINSVPAAESISFMPYQKDLDKIRLLADNYDGADQWKYRFIYESPDAALAYLPNNGHYKDLNRFEFIVPQKDIDLLTGRVKKAVELLLDDGKSVTAAAPDPAQQIPLSANNLII